MTWDNPQFFKLIKKYEEHDLYQLDPYDCLILVDRKTDAEIEKMVGNYLNILFKNEDGSFNFEKLDEEVERIIDRFKNPLSSYESEEDKRRKIGDGNFYQVYIDGVEPFIVNNDEDLLNETEDKIDEMLMDMPVGTKISIEILKISTEEYNSLKETKQEF